MSLDHIIGIAGTALNAQITRMNTTASNLANAGTTAPTESEVFRAKRPVFKALVEAQMTHGGAPFVGGVKVDRITDDPAPARMVFDPRNPMANADGYVYQANISEVGEMVDMMAASRAYQNNVEVINTARQLMMRTLDLTKA